MTLEAGRYEARELLMPVYADGKRVYNSPPVMEIRDYCAKQKDMLWDEHKRLINPHEVPVDLSDELYELKRRMIHEARGR
jgi:nicotinate phosphoribosyltransferase